MGGGDDLGSDDEYLSTRVVGVADGHDEDDDDNSSVMGSATSSSGGDDEESNKASDDDVGVGILSSKRKMISSTDLQEGRDNDHVPDKKRKKKSGRKDPSAVLLDAAKQLERQTVKDQSTFLDTALRHHKLTSMSLSSSSSSSPLKEDDIPQGLIQPQHLFRSSRTTETTNFVDQLKEAVSLKKLKKWKHQNSPCVIIVCISARRAVAVLKDLSRLKIRMAKLFPKNGPVEEQRQQLASNAFGVAVATPHRLNVLLSGSGSSSSNSKEAQGGGRGGDAMSLDRTQLIVLDCHMSNKQYTVCTLPDTAPHCMGMLYDHVLPQLQRRKDLRLAFF